MEMDNSLSQQISAAFGKKSLYEVLNVDQNASSEDIRRGYRRMALKMHPDKGGDPEQFKALCVVHAILSDETKRRLYDTTGEVDTQEMSEEAEVWYDYFRNLFPKVTIDRIEEFSKTYKSSEEERNDIIKYYSRFEGDFGSIMGSVMLVEDEDSERIVDIIRDCLSTGEANGQFADCFESTSSKYIEKYKKKLEKEAKVQASGKSKKASKEDDTDALLQQMIQNNARRRAGGDSAFADILSKYSDPNVRKVKGGQGKKSNPPRGRHEDISDEAFEATQAKLTANNKKRKGGL